MSASIHHFARTSGAQKHLNTLDLRLEVRDAYYAQAYLLFCLGVLPVAAACDRSPDIVSEAQRAGERARRGNLFQLRSPGP